MAVYTQWEPLDDDPLTEEQEVRWDDDGIMYIVGLAGESSEEDSTPEQDWTKQYNFGGTYIGPVFRGVVYNPQGKPTDDLVSARATATCPWSTPVDNVEGMFDDAEEKGEVVQSPKKKLGFEEWMRAEGSLDDDETLEDLDVDEIADYREEYEEAGGIAYEHEAIFTKAGGAEAWEFEDETVSDTYFDVQDEDLDGIEIDYP